MLLVQMNTGSTIYISNEYLDIEHFYDPYIASLSQLRVETREAWGGFAEPTFGSIDLLPTAFTGNWPPPMSCYIKVMIARTGESNAETVFEGTAYLKSVGRDSVQYDLYGPESYATTEIDRVYDATLNSVFSSACSVLGLTLNTTYARAVSPPVKYTAEGENKIIDNLSDIAAFFTHRFYIQAGTLYLVDLFLDNGSVLELTEFDIFPSNYTTNSPYKQILSKYTPSISKYRFTFGNVQDSDDTYVSITEVELKTEADGPDVTNKIGGTASAMNYYLSTMVPAYAVDDVATTRWTSLTYVGTRPWWQFDFNSPTKIVEYSFMLHTYINFAPTAWNVKVYDEHTSLYRQIDYVTTDPDWVVNEIRKFSLDIPEWDAIVAGSYPFGDVLEISPVCHTDINNIITALNNIKAAVEARRIEMVKPLSGVPKIGQKITLTDESLLQSTSVWARVSAIVWDFDQEQCVIEGIGFIS